MQLWIRDPLAFPPGRSPGFDPTHIAGENVRFSCIASGANFLRLAGTGARIGTISGTAPVYSIDGELGPVATWSSVGGTQRVQFTTQRPVQDQMVTIAAIVRFSSITTTGQTVFVAGTTGGTGSIGLRFQSSSPGMYLDTFGAGDFPGFAAASSGIAVGIPFFVVGSGISILGGAVTPLANYLVKRLDTGKITSTSVSGTGTLTAPTTFTYEVGNNQNNGGGMAASVAAVMYSGQFLSFSQLRQWADDPWSFWYPNIDDILFAEIVGKAATSINPFQSNIFYM